MHRSIGWRSLVSAFVSVWAVACSSPATPSVDPPSATPTRFMLSGTVTHDEIPVVGASVQLSIAGTRQTATTDNDGIFSFGGVNAGTGTLTVSADGYHQVERTVTIAADVDLPVSLTPITDSPPSVPVTTVNGTVVDQTTMAPIADADIDLVVTAEQRFRTTTDAMGHWLLSDVPIGVSAELRISATGHTTLAVPITVTETMTIPPTGLVPSTPPPPPGPPSGGLTTALRLIDVFTRSGIAGLVVTGADLLSEPSSSTGETSVTVDTADAEPRRIIVSGPGYVTRETDLRVPGEAAEIALIPNTFNIGCYNEIARWNGGIARWTEPPPLFVVTQSVLFERDNFDTGTRDTRVMTQDEIQSIQGDMEAALGPLTGTAMTAFESETHGEATGPTPEVVTYAVPGAIAVYHAKRLAEEMGFAGGTTVELEGDRIVSAVIWLDQGYEDAGIDSRKIRSHELGHALGYAHPSSASCHSLMSIMSGSGSDSFTDLDLQLMALTYQRPAGNRSPDIDPFGTSINRGGRRRVVFTWSHR